MPAARREAALRAGGEALRAALGGRDFASFAALAEELPGDARAACARAVGLVAPPAPAGADPQPRVIRVSLATLQKFLCCPIQGAAARVLGIDPDDDDEDPSERQDEPLALELLERLASMKDAVHEVIARRRDLADAVREQLERLRAAGTLPPGIYGDWEGGKLAATVAAWAQLLRARVPDVDGSGEVLRLGATHGRELGWHQAEPPLSIGVPPEGAHGLPGGARVEITGRIALLARDRELLVSFTPGAGKVGAQPRDQVKARVDALRGFVVHVVLEARGDDSRERRLLRVGSEALGEHTLRAVGAPAARAYLLQLVGDLLAGTHDRFLPAEAVLLRDLARPEAGPARRFADCVAEVRQWARGERWRLQTSYGPLANSDEQPVPGEDEAAAIEARRYARFFATLVTPPAAPKPARKGKKP